MVSGKRDNHHSRGNFQFISLQNSTIRLQLDRGPVPRNKTTRVGELSRPGRKGNPGKRDNFSSHKCFGSLNRDNSRRGECHVMPRFRIYLKQKLVSKK